MKKTILFWFLIAIITASPVAMAGDDFNFDHSDAADYGAGILKSLLHAPWKDQASLSSFDMTKPILEAIKSKDEKRFIFVGFRVATGTGGFMVIFQVCENGELNSWTHYAVTDYGLAGDLEARLEDYRAIRAGDAESMDIGDACPTDDRD